MNNTWLWLHASMMCSAFRYQKQCHRRYFCRCNTVSYKDASEGIMKAVRYSVLGKFRKATWCSVVVGSWPGLEAEELGHAKGREKYISAGGSSRRPRGLCDYSAARGQSNVGLGQTENQGHSAPTKPFKGIYLVLYAQSPVTARGISFSRGIFLWQVGSSSLMRVYLRALHWEIQNLLSLWTAGTSRLWSLFPSPVGIPSCVYLLFSDAS